MNMVYYLTGLKFPMPNISIQRLAVRLTSAREFSPNKVRVCYLKKNVCTCFS